MDENVIAAMKRWPNVPDCYGWLGLGDRGDWFIRDLAAQQVGMFQGDGCSSRGDRIEHEGLISFINRNYVHDEKGMWFFQNGPQKVFVELQSTPWIWRMDDSGKITSHTGLEALAKQYILDEAGRLYIKTNLGFGLLHSQDVWRASEYLENKENSLVEINSSQLEIRFDFIKSPAVFATALPE